MIAAIVLEAELYDLIIDSGHDRFLGVHDLAHAFPRYRL